MRIACVVGGSGFLGSHVADALCESGYAVRIFDRQYSKWLSPGQEMIVGDLLDEVSINDVVAGCEVVYNFAALADLNDALEKPLDTIRVNILGNAHVIEACIKHVVRRYVYASTLYVHSREGGFYRCSKQAAEQYLEEYHRWNGLDYTILRYGSLYGPRADNSNGLYRIVKRALESGVVSYTGSADAMRSYIHVEDAARASVTALGGEFRNQSIVLTGQEPTRVLDLLEMLKEILGIEKKVRFESADQLGHYVRTPYAYLPKLGRRYVMPMHVDLGQGLIQLIEGIRGETQQSGQIY